MRDKSMPEVVYKVIQIRDQEALRLIHLRAERERRTLASAAGISIIEHLGSQGSGGAAGEQREKTVSGSTGCGKS